MGLCLTGDVSVWYFSRSPCPSILANGTHTLTDGTSRHHNVHKNAFRCFTKTLVDAKVSVFFLLGIEPTRSIEGCTRWSRHAASERERSASFDSFPFLSFPSSSASAIRPYTCLTAGYPTSRAVWSVPSIPSIEWAAQLSRPPFRRQRWSRGTRPRSGRRQAGSISRTCVRGPGVRLMLRFSLGCAALLCRVCDDCSFFPL